MARRISRFLVAAGVVTGLVGMSTLAEGTSAPPASGPPPSTPVASLTPAGPGALATLPASGLTVTLQRLAAGSNSVAVGTDARMFVQATGVAPLATIELWAGGDLVDRATAPGDDPTWVGPLAWRPQAEGAVGLTARVVDVDGRAATSNVVTMLAVAPSAPLPVLAYVTEPGDTPARVAAQFGLPADLPLVPDQPADEPFPPGTELDIPILTHLADIPPAAPAPAPPDLATTTAAPDAIPPVVAEVSAENCSVTVTSAAAGTADEAALVQVLPGSGVFEALAGDVAADHGHFADVPLGQGLHLFAVRTVTGGISAMSPPVRVEGPEGCGGGWDGPLAIDHGLLTGVPDDIDRAFLYLTTGGAWQRVPAAGQTTVARRAGQFDLRRALPDLDGATTVTIEGWGWRGTTLVELGRSTFTAADGVPLVARLGRSRGTRLVMITEPGGSGSPATPEQTSVEAWLGDPGVETFRWSTDVAGTTHGVWQVLAFPPLPTTSPLTAGVLAEGVLEGTGGTFEIDLGAVFGDTPVASADAFTQVVAYADIGGPASAEYVAVMPSGPAVAGGASAPAAGALTVDTAGDLLMPPVDDVFIRVVPMAGDQWPGGASNTVSVHDKYFYDPAWFTGEPVDPAATAYTMSATLFPPTPPNPAYINCWQFVKWRPDLQDPAYALEYAYWNSLLEDVGFSTPLCPGVCYSWFDQDGVVFGYKAAVKTIFGDGSCSSGSGGLGIPIVDDLIDAGLSLWNAFVSVFTSIKQWVVDVVADLSGCNTIASAVADDADAQAFCGAMATLAVNAAMVYFGIPPSLPNSEQLKAMAKGEMKALMIEAAKDLGIPCDEIGTGAEATGQEQFSCEAIADKMLSEVEKKISEYFVEAAASSSGISFPPGAVIQPAPQGQTGAPRVEVTVTPSTGAPTLGGRECAAIVSVGAIWSPSLSPTSFADAVYASKVGLGQGAPARLPGWSNISQLWAVPMATYQGPVNDLAVVRLPTEELAYQLSGPQPSATRPFFLTPAARDPVGAIQVWAFGPSPSGFPSSLPYHALQLHADALVAAEIYSPCTGLYRAVLKLPSGPVPFAPVP